MADSNRIAALYDEHGQSAWLDNLKRGYITSGELVAIRDGGVRGLTSNPSIFQKAIQDSSDYDEQFAALRAEGNLIVDDYWSLVIRDIHSACDVFSKVYDHSKGVGSGALPGLPQAASSKAEAAKARAFFVMCDLFMYSSSVMNRYFNQLNFLVKKR